MYGQGVAIKSKQKVAGYSQDIHATSSLMGIFCQIINYCSLHGKQLDKIGGGGCFSPSVDHITHDPPQELASHKG